MMWVLAQEFRRLLLRRTILFIFAVPQEHSGAMFLSIFAVQPIIYAHDFFYFFGGLWPWFATIMFVLMSLLSYIT